jgi:hypothetical protein
MLGLISFGIDSFESMAGDRENILKTCFSAGSHFN